MDVFDREAKLKFAARYGDRHTFDALGGSPEQWGRWKSVSRSQDAMLKRGIV